MKTKSNMKKNFMPLKVSMLLGLFVVLFLGMPSLLIKVNIFRISERTNQAILEEIPKEPKTSSISNSELINSLFTSKVDDYDNLGYFLNVYESSLQATYYALYILNAIGKINAVNQTQIVGYIMSYYDAGSNSFIDKLAKRYQDTDFSLGYFYPLTSVLQTTSYAILSLNILGELGKIDIQGTINFTWSCYVTTENGGGFMGQPYDAGLDTNFKIPTLDNTYFAILTLDILMTDWFGYTNNKAAIIQFINDLQLTGGSSWDTGGFLNDDEISFDSMNPLFEPNLLSSYYAIKTLEIFGAEDTISEVNFHKFLAYLYDSKENSFRMSEWDYGMSYTNIVATSIGLELSGIANFSSVDKNSTLAFILDNRNSIGNWDGSLLVPQHELIDSFQIIRSLKNIGELSELSLNDKNEIGNAIQLYYHYNGYSHLSEDYTSLNHVFTLTSSYELFDRIFELDIQPLYSKIKNSYDNSSQGINSFSGYLLKRPGFNLLRSHPIEFFSSGKKNHIQEITQLKSHQSTYYALVSLEKLFKLDDFASLNNLMDLFNDIIDTQFLDDSYNEAFGGFTSVYRYEVSRSEFLSKKIFLKYSYYAIRSLELIKSFLGLGEVNYSSYGLDEIGLYNYIEGRVVEDSQYIFYNPQYSSNTETKIEYTYYMIWMLKTLNLFNKDLQKIKNFIESYVDYTNIKAIYYSFKISEILDLKLGFDFEAIQELVQTIYSEETREFYIASDHQEINHEVFLWICEMAKKSKIGIEANYLDVVTLGGYNNISVSLYKVVNLVLEERLHYLSQLSFIDQKGDNLYTKVIRKDLLRLNTELVRIVKGTGDKTGIYSALSINAQGLILFHMLELIEQQGLDVLLDYLEKLNINAKKKNSSKASKILAADNRIRKIFLELKKTQEFSPDNLVHPKYHVLVKVLIEELSKNLNARILVFVKLRNSVKNIVNKLADIETIKPARFVGQATKSQDDRGLSQKRQVEILKEFKQGVCNVLVSTNVGEEGLDIAECDLVIFYDVVASEIRLIQRKGRTARHREGKVVILYCKGTHDEIYLRIALSKLKRMNNVLKNPQQLESFSHESDNVPHSRESFIKETLDKKDTTTSKKPHQTRLQQFLGGETMPEDIVSIKISKLVPLKFGLRKNLAKENISFTITDTDLHIVIYNKVLIQILDPKKVDFTNLLSEIQELKQICSLLIVIFDFIDYNNSRESRILKRKIQELGKLNRLQFIPLNNEEELSFIVKNILENSR